MDVNAQKPWHNGYFLRLNMKAPLSLCCLTALLFAGCATQQSLNEIPSVYQGRWSPSIAACSKAFQVDLFTIYPRQINFWETAGLTETIELNDSELRLKLNMWGEDQQWEEQMVYRYLLKQDRLQFQLGDQLKVYQRCPSLAED